MSLLVFCRPEGRDCSKEVAEVPQVLMIVAPRLVPAFSEEDGEKRLEKIGQALISKTEQAYSLEGKNDVAFTAIPALCVIGDADIQLEVRFTAGEDEYGQGKPFEPSKTLMGALALALMDVLVEGLLSEVEPPISSLSVWVIPLKGTLYKYRKIL